MSEYVTLLGAETVDQAARNMAGAAETMQRAAAHFDEVATRLIYALDEASRRLADNVERIERLAAEPTSGGGPL